MSFVNVTWGYEENLTEAKLNQAQANTVAVYGEQDVKVIVNGTICWGDAPDDFHTMVLMDGVQIGTTGQEFFQDIDISSLSAGPHTISIGRNHFHWYKTGADDFLTIFVQPHGYNGFFQEDSWDYGASVTALVHPVARGFA